VVGLLHLAQGVLMLLLATDLALPVTAAFLDQDPVTVTGPVPPETLFELPIAPAIALFLFLAAADHLAMLLPRVRSWYRRSLERRSNYARWIEYSVSASLMIVLIAIFCGVFDIVALLGIFAANSAMILFGLLMERSQQPGAADWSPFWFGCLVGLIPWVGIGIYLANGSPPGFVIGIYVSLFVLFNSFAVNMALQYKQVGRWRDYVFGESVYIVLSLTAKSLLAWQIYANVLRS
jgi:hypothetical protein